MKTHLAALTACFILSGCRVGPDYVVPETPIPESFNEEQPDKIFPTSDEDLVHWWAAFNDPFLEELMEEALGANFDYRIALSQVAQARSNYWVQFTQILPDIGWDGQGSHYRSSQAFPTAAASGLSPIQNFFQTGLTVKWEIDLFGKLRRTADSAYASWQAAAEEARAVKILVLSEVATTFTQICALQAKIGIASHIVEADEDLLLLALSRFNTGLANQQEVDSLQSQLQVDSAALMTLEASFKNSVYSLAVLLGRLPESVADDFTKAHPIPYAGGKVPTGVPADLLLRRPDIAQAERQLAAATELIGVAVADLYPTVDLIGSTSSFAANPLQGANVGYSSPVLHKLFHSGSRIWGYGTLVTWPVFDFGQRLSTVHIQEAIADQAYLAYQKTVITALQEVEQSLSTYFIEESKLTVLAKQTAANKQTLQLTEDLYQSGLASMSDVDQARDAWLSSLNTETDSRQALATDLIAIYKSLGGDW